jgi:hypothetical protein
MFREPTASKRLAYRRDGCERRGPEDSPSAETSAKQIFLLVAQQQVDDGIAAFLLSRSQAKDLRRSVVGGHANERSRNVEDDPNCGSKAAEAEVQPGAHLIDM